MTNEEVIAKMWEAYKFGDGGDVDHFNEGAERTRFDEWLAKDSPELLQTEKYKHTDMMCHCDETVPLGDKSKGCCCYD